MHACVQACTHTHKRTSKTWQHGSRRTTTSASPPPVSARTRRTCSDRCPATLANAVPAPAQPRLPRPCIMLGTRGASGHMDTIMQFTTCCQRQTYPSIYTHAHISRTHLGIQLVIGYTRVHCEIQRLTQPHLGVLDDLIAGASALPVLDAPLRPECLAEIQRRSRAPDTCKCQYAAPSLPRMRPV